MSSDFISEIQQLTARVNDLAEEVLQMKSDHEGFATMKSRIVALEAGQQATNQRFAHLDRVLLDMQGDLRGMRRTIVDMQSANSKELSELRVLLNKILEFVTPKQA